MKRTTKADQILAEARQRLEAAEREVQVTQEALSSAQAARDAHQMAYDALEKALAPKPRKKPAAVAQKELPTTIKGAA